MADSRITQKIPQHTASAMIYLSTGFMDFFFKSITAIYAIDVNLRFFIVHMVIRM